ncbi:MAG: cytochrome b N-terminal domain-containing protein [Planctomycetota bacterium]
MMPLFHWLDQRTGLLTSLGNWFQRPIAGGPAWRFVWPTTIAFAFMVQAISGLVLWMYYSAGAQSSWESVYYLQYQVTGGWLLRAMHFYMGQTMLVLVGIYLVQMILRGTYRAPREFLFWTVLLMGLATLGLNLTGDLLSWDQNSFWATSIRIAYLSHLPMIGPWLSKLAIGGPQFGTLALTRFLALHIGICTAALLGLILLHAHLASRHGLEASRLPSRSGRGAGGEGVPYWPHQAWRDVAACFIVLVIVVGLSASHGVRGPQAGIELGAPANPIDDPGTARPEWSFRGLYQLHEMLGGWSEMISIFVIPGLTVLLFFAMPFIGRNLAGRSLNIALTLLVLSGLGLLTWQSYSGDTKNEKYQVAMQEGHQQAQRVKELAESPQKIPASGAGTLLRMDAMTQGPRIFNQYCANCHDFSGLAIVGINRPEKPTAPDLYGFASRKWLTDFMQVKGISSPRFFGNTKFKQKKMYGFIKETFAELDVKEQQQIIQALSHEAALKLPSDADRRDLANSTAGKNLITENCTDCHTFHSPHKGTGARGPDLTGYGSRDWLIGIVGNSAHTRFYGKENDRMPVYVESATDTKKNVLSQQELELLVDWLRGEWYEPEKSSP